MPQVIRPSTVTVVSDNNGRTHMVITLELDLNINLNSNNVEATTQIVEPSKKKSKKVAEDDFAGFEIPDFSSTEKIKFGKKISDE